MTTSTKQRPAKQKPLSEAAQALRDHLEREGDSISAQIAAGEIYWSLTKSGLALRARDVRALKSAGLIEPFGLQLDPNIEAACYVLKGAEPAKITGERERDPGAYACGNTNVANCTQGLCLDCAPLAMCERIRAGEELVPKNWIGPAP